MLESNDREIVILGISMVINEMETVEDYNCLKTILYNAYPKRCGRGACKPIRIALQKKHFENIKNRKLNEKEIITETVKKDS